MKICLNINDENKVFNLQEMGYNFACPVIAGPHTCKTFQIFKTNQTQQVEN